MRTIHERGHLGRDKVVGQISARFYWKTLYTDVSQFVSQNYKTSYIITVSILILLLPSLSIDYILWHLPTSERKVWSPCTLPPSCTSEIRSVATDWHRLNRPPSTYPQWKQVHNDSNWLLFKMARGQGPSFKGSGSHSSLLIFPVHAPWVLSVCNIWPRSGIL